MSKADIYNFCKYNGVPDLVYKWSFSDLDGTYLDKKLSKILDDIDSFLESRGSFIIYFSENSLLASRVAATFIKAAFISGYAAIKYINPESLVGYKLESWDNGNAYTDLLEADLLVLDRIEKINSDKFPKQVFEEFVETRILNGKSTLFVAHDEVHEIFSEKILSLFKQAGIKVLSEHGVANVK